MAAEASGHPPLPHPGGGGGWKGGFDLDWLPSTHTNNKKAIFRPGKEVEEEETEKRHHLRK